MTEQHCAVEQHNKHCFFCVLVLECVFLDNEAVFALACVPAIDDLAQFFHTHDCLPFADGLVYVIGQFFDKVPRLYYKFVLLAVLWDAASIPFQKQDVPREPLDRSDQQVFEAVPIFASPFDILFKQRRTSLYVSCSVSFYNNVVTNQE